MKIISGGQTGVDRTALEIAIKMKLPHGGWCPKGRRAEDGVIPDCFLLQETSSRNYAIRTRRNIEDSDGTLVFFDEALTGGTALTCRLAKSLKKPLLVMDANQLDTTVQKDVDRIYEWYISNHVLILNVAGPRCSSSPKLPNMIEPVLKSLFQKLSLLDVGKT